jgi:serine/threonine protein kinase
MAHEKGGPGTGHVLRVPWLREFTLAELREVTRGFKPDMVLGEGSFGRVYKGWVDNERTLNPAKSGVGVMVAVKKLKPEIFRIQGLQEWQVSVHPPAVYLLVVSSSACYLYKWRLLIIMRIFFVTQVQSEVKLLGRLSHPNLVRLLGYCSEDRELLLVYEYMSRGSLFNHLFRGKTTYFWHSSTFQLFPTFRSIPKTWSFTKISLEAVNRAC